MEKGDGKPVPPTSSLLPRDILRTRPVLMSTGCYGLIAMIFILFDETLPLHAKLPVGQGGFGFSPQEIGILLSIGGIGIGFMSLFLFPRLHVR